MEIAIDKDITDSDLKKFFDQKYPDQNFKILICFSEHDGNGKPVVFKRKEKGYPINLDFSLDVAENVNFLHMVSCEISRTFCCNVWYCEPLYKMDDSPYWSTLYNSGVAYIVDDVKIEDFNTQIFESLIIIEKADIGKIKGELHEYLTR